MSVVRLALPVIGGPGWIGGWNYMLNLVRTVSEFGPADFEIVVFAGTDVEHADLDALATLPRTRVVHEAAFDADRRQARLVRALTTGLDTAALGAFRTHGATAAFEPAQFFGWRFPMPVVAWIPDFQHRLLPHFFSRAARMRREIGFRAQILARRTMMLSSADAEADCHRFYPASRSRTRVVRFTAADTKGMSAADARARADALGVPERFLFLPNQLWSHKNHATAIDAAGILAAQGSDAVIVATGHGVDPRQPDLRAELDRRITERAAERNFRFLGALPYADVQALNLCANAIINPSRFEGWSTSVEEAKAAGTPLLLSDIPVHREQAPSDAAFFAPDSPERLALLVAQTRMRSPELIEQQREAATVSLTARRRAFASAFVAVARGVQPTS